MAMPCFGSSFLDYDTLERTDATERARKAGRATEETSKKRQRSPSPNDAGGWWKRFRETKRFDDHADASDLRGDTSKKQSVKTWEKRKTRGQLNEKIRELETKRLEDQKEIARLKARLDTTVSIEENRQAPTPDSDYENDSDAGTENTPPPINDDEKPLDNFVIDILARVYFDYTVVLLQDKPHGRYTNYGNILDGGVESATPIEWRGQDRLEAGDVYAFTEGLLYPLCKDDRQKIVRRLHLMNENMLQQAIVPYRAGAPREGERVSVRLC